MWSFIALHSKYNKYKMLFVTLPQPHDNNSINKNFKLTIQLFEDMFRRDSCDHQFNVLFRFPLFYLRL